MLAGSVGHATAMPDATRISRCLIPRTNRPHLPSTGSFLTAVAPVLRPSCVTHGPMAPGGEADRGHSAGSDAGGCRDAVDVPWPVSGSGPRKWARAPGRPGSRQAAKPREHHHAKRHRRTKITRAEPPLCADCRPFDVGWLALLKNFMHAPGVPPCEFS
jgi:hypothetical protein